MNTKILNFVLISVYHTKEKDQFFYLWRPNNAGYTKNQKEAGIYTNLPKKKSDTLYKPEGYHNTFRTLPVEIDSHIYRNLERETFKDEIKILNNDHNCRLLGITSDGKDLKRGISKF